MDGVADERRMAQKRLPFRALESSITEEGSYSQPPIFLDFCGGPTHQPTLLMNADKSQSQAQTISVATTNVTTTNTLTACRLLSFEPTFSKN